MQASLIDIQKFEPQHLDAAVELSRQAGWPHRREDWALVLSLSKGFVAIENGRVVGTAMATLRRHLRHRQHGDRGRGHARPWSRTQADAGGRRCCGKSRVPSDRHR